MYSNGHKLPKNATYTIYSTTNNNISHLKEDAIESPNSIIDISDIKSGYYILMIQTEYGQQSLKFSK